MRPSLTAAPAVYNVSDGRLLASVDLPAYLSSGLADDDLSSSPSSSFSSSSSFCLLQVSADLSTAVAVTQSHAAIAVDLDHYFRSAFLLFCFVSAGLLESDAAPPLSGMRAATTEA